MVPVTTKQFLCSLCFLTMNFARILHGESSGERSDSSPNAKKKVGKKQGGKSMFIPLNYAYSGGPLGVSGTGVPIRPATSAPVATSARCAQCVWCERSSTWPPLQNIDFSEPRRVKSWETITPIPRVYGKL